LRLFRALAQRPLRTSPGVIPKALSRVISSAFSAVIHIALQHGECPIPHKLTNSRGAGKVQTHPSVVQQCDPRSTRNRYSGRSIRLRRPLSPSEEARRVVTAICELFYRVPTNRFNKRLPTYVTGDAARPPPSPRTHTHTQQPTATEPTHYNTHTGKRDRSVDNHAVPVPRAVFSYSVYFVSTPLSAHRQDDDTHRCQRPHTRVHCNRIPPRFASSTLSNRNQPAEKCPNSLLHASPSGRRPSRNRLGCPFHRRLRSR
jgi:hypothetical protein